VLVSGVILLVFVLVALRSARSERDQAIDLNGPLPGYPPCEAFVPAERGERVEDAILPGSAVITRVRRDGLSRRINGFVPLRPIQVRKYYQSRPGVQVLQIEDEIIEAEALLTDGEFRMYIKAVAVCESGSEFEALVAPELAAADLPTPAGTPAP
jgi:hypothetical protein